MDAHENWPTHITLPHHCTLNRSWWGTQEDGKCPEDQLQQLPSRQNSPRSQKNHLLSLRQEPGLRFRQSHRYGEDIINPNGPRIGHICRWYGGLAVVSSVSKFGIRSAERSDCRVNEERGGRQSNIQLWFAEKFQQRSRYVKNPCRYFERTLQWWKAIIQHHAPSNQVNIQLQPQTIRYQPWFPIDLHENRPAPAKTVFGIAHAVAVSFPRAAASP